MLRVSTKGEYGVRIMVDLARHYSERPRSLTDISQAEALPLAYLEQLVKLLREAEPPLVVSTRGAHGGYRLSRSPEEISMGEIVRILEGPISPMICATEGEMSQVCSFLDACKTKYLWARVRDAVAQTLDSITLAELVAAEAADTVGHAPQFIALSDIHSTAAGTDLSCPSQPTKRFHGHDKSVPAEGFIGVSQKGESELRSLQ